MREERERERQQLSRCARQHTTNMRIMKKPHLNNKLLHLDGFSLFAAERLKIRQMKRDTRVGTIRIELERNRQQDDDDDDDDNYDDDNDVV